MKQLKNELLEIRGELNYGVLDGKIKNELYQSLIDRVEKALALCEVSESSPKNMVKLLDPYIEDVDCPSGVLYDGRYSEAWVLEEEYRKNKITFKER